MAIHKRGKKGLYHAYFRGLDERPDGTLVMVKREVNLHTSDARTAAALDLQLREREARHRAELRARAFARQLLSPRDGAEPVTAVTPLAVHRPRRLRLADALDAAAKYAAVSPSAAVIWRAFCASVTARYMDEVTPQALHDYLSRFKRAKTYNNIRGAINRIFTLTLLESGLDRSPAALIPARRTDARHQRPFTVEEFRRIYAAAPEPWRTASIVAWHTGLRQADVFGLRWEQLVGGVITTKPGKTARFGRAVQIPVHPQLADALDAIPHSGPYILGRWCPAGRVRQYQREVWAKLLSDLGIKSDPSGLVTFNSFRDSFVSRLDAAGIPRHAIRGLVGHVSDDTTDLYSHDLETARRIIDLPPVSLPPPECKPTQTKQR